MFDPSGLGKLLTIAGLLILLLGVALMLAGKWPGAAGLLNWVGRLPGDILVKREGVTFYFPVVTSLLISVVGSMLLYLFLKRP